MIRFTCPKCEAKFMVPDTSQGERRKCPKCGTSIKVPPSADAGASIATPVPAERKTFVRVQPTSAGGEIPMQDEPVESEATPAPLPTARPEAGGLLIVPIQDVTKVDFQELSILDAPVIEAIGKELYALVDQRAKRKIILDFSNVQFLSSQMLGVIINLHKRSASIKGKVVLCGLRPDLMKVFTMMKIDKFLSVVTGESDAMRVLGVREA